MIRGILQQSGQKGKTIVKRLMENWDATSGEIIQQKENLNGKSN
jgi:hypothetical protein